MNTALSLRDAALAVDRRRARSRQRKLGPSALGECRRRAGYIHHRTVPLNPEDGSSLPAISGTWFHTGALRALAAEFGALVETRLADDVIKGSVDALWLPAPMLRKVGVTKETHLALAPDQVVVEDLKTKRDARMVDYYRHKGPPITHLFQSHKYAAMLREGSVATTPKRQERLAELGPLEVERIRLRVIDRNGDDEYVYEQDYDPDIAEAADEWLRQILESKSAESLPRDLDGPGLSVICDNCPFRRNCWGEYEDADVAPQAQLVTNTEEVEAALRAYVDAQAREVEAKAEKAMARAMLDGTPSCELAGIKLSWGGGRIPKDAVPKPDVEAMLALFKQAGLEVPYLPPKPGPRIIRVTRTG